MDVPKRRRSRPPERPDFEQQRSGPAAYDSKEITDSKETTPYLLAMVARFQAHLYSVRTADTGVSLAGAFLLLELGQEEPLSHSDLSARLSIAHTTVAQTLKRLEQGGFVERSINPTDKRQVKVRLTPKGREACNPLRAEGDVLAREIRSLLGEEKEKQLREYLSHLAEHFRIVKG